MRRLYDRHLTTCSGGNISRRIDEDLILITPSALDKGNICAEDIALLTIDGKNLTAGLKTSIETEMHLEIFRRRPDVQAVVHAHPLHASLFTATEKVLRTDLLAEARYMLGAPVKAPYALMGTSGLASAVGAAILSEPLPRVLLLENHGVLTIGTSLYQAYDRMEVLEEAAKMSYMGELLGGLEGLTPDRIAEIDAM